MLEELRICKKFACTEPKAPDFLRVSSYAQIVFKVLPNIRNASLTLDRIQLGCRPNLFSAE